MEARMEPRGQSITNNTENPKGNTVNFRPINGRITIGVDGTDRSGCNPQI